MRYSGTVTLPVDRSGWYLLRAIGDSAHTPVLDVYPYATTSPIYLTVGGAPIRSADDAKYFLAWLDRLAQGVATYPEFNSEAERAMVQAQIAAARRVFEGMMR
jgi:hypothetical protein